MGIPRISIAMATFNGERFLQEQLDSLADQTVLPYELIVCDDGSTDATISILEAFSSVAPFPVNVFVNDSTLGSGRNFLKAASLCAGDWIAFCDQDDVWFVQKLSRIADVIHTIPKADMISHSALQVGEHLQRLRKVRKHPGHMRLSVTGPLRNRPMRALPGFSCVFRARMFQSVPYEARPRDMYRPERLEPHDNFVYNLTNTYGYIVRLPDILAFHRRHEGTVTGDPGTGIKKGYRAAKLTSHGARHGEALTVRADGARAHREFYKWIQDNVAPKKSADYFAERTSAAVEYYGSLATSYDARAAIYSKGTSFRRKLKALHRCLNIRAYGDHAGGRGIGSTALLRDLAAVLFSW